MTWSLTWLNVSVATLNVTLQLLVIYRLGSLIVYAGGWSELLMNQFLYCNYYNPKSSI